MTTSHMKMLDDFEGGYHRVPCVVKLYNGKIVNSFVYKMDEKKLIDNNHSLPTERYLDIIGIVIVIIIVIIVTIVIIVLLL